MTARNNLARQSLSILLALGICTTPEFVMAQGPQSNSQSQTQNQNSPGNQLPAEATGNEPVDAQADAAEAATSEESLDAGATESGSTGTPATQSQAQNPDPRFGQRVDPAAGPQSPVNSNRRTTGTLPDAPSAQQAPETNPAPANAATPPQRSTTTFQQPSGTAAAEGAQTVGGPASKPAGTAIAPAKQRQVRSFLIKLGAIAAAGAAIGTVYALSRGTGSTPPGSGR